jgi:NAD+ synthase
VKEGELYNAVAFLDAGGAGDDRQSRPAELWRVRREAGVSSRPMPGPFSIRGVRIGVPICEDIWGHDPVECLSETGTELLLVPNGSPFDALKRDHRLNVAVARVVDAGLPLVYLNQVGRPGRAGVRRRLVRAQRGPPVGGAAAELGEALVITSWKREAEGWVCEPGRGCRNRRPEFGALFRNGSSGLKDYVNKNRFPGVVLGLSGRHRFPRSPRRLRWMRWAPAACAA